MSSAPRRRSSLLFALLAVGVLAAAAPTGCAKAIPCELNSDCPFGYCQNGACQKSCVDASRDCPPGYACDQNAQCVIGTGGSSSASSSAGTGTGGAAQSSSSGTGAGGPSSSSGTGASTSSSTSTSTSSSTSSTSSSTSASSSSGAAMNKHELDLCASDGDCASPLVCRPTVHNGAMRCTPTCSSNADCTSGSRCELLGGTMYCAGDDTGRPCSMATDCNFGCLGAYCTVACDTGADCPNGYGCMGVGNPPTRVCVKAEAPCDTGDTSACLGSAFCDVTAQMVVGGCTTQCSSASDCPQRAEGFNPWTCDTAAGGLCRRPGDVFGPLPVGATPAQYACNAASMVVNVCNDAQHIDFGAFSIPAPPVVSCTATMTTAGIATDSCEDSCRYQGSCPFGFACIAVGGVGTSRIGLCLPTGGGEVGAACVHDSDCVFGYCPSALGKCSRDCTADGVCPTGSTCTAAGGPPVEGQAFRRCQ